MWGGPDMPFRSCAVATSACWAPLATARAGRSASSSAQPAGAWREGVSGDLEGKTACEHRASHAPAKRPTVTMIDFRRASAVHVATPERAAAAWGLRAGWRGSRVRTWAWSIAPGSCAGGENPLNLRNWITAGSRALARGTEHAARAARSRKLTRPQRIGRTRGRWLIHVHTLPLGSPPGSLSQRFLGLWSHFPAANKETTLT